MYTGFLHLHVLLVSLFLLTTLIKTVLLFSKSTGFETYRAKTKVPEIIITILFLLTGIGLLVMKSGAVHFLFWIKLLMIFAAIPLAVIGFKKKNKIPAMIGTFLFIIAFGVSEMASKKAPISHVETTEDLEGTVEHGQKLYEKNCTSCHGEDGAKKLAAATDLSQSVLSLEQTSMVLKSGKGNMPSFAALSEIEISALTQYLQTLKKN